MISRRGLFNVVLMLILIAVLAFNEFTRPDPTLPNVEYFPDMAHSKRYNGFSANPIFADGKTLQAPVPGTIPRGVTLIHYAATPEDAARAGDELTNPFAGSAAALDRGGFVFSNFCSECHGSAAKGDGSVAMRGFPPPPSLLLPHAVNMKDGQLFHILAYGQANMPSYASQLSKDDRWKVIVYLRSLQQRFATPVPAIPAEVAPTPAPVMKGGK